MRSPVSGGASRLWGMALMVVALVGLSSCASIQKLVVEEPPVKLAAYAPYNRAMSLRAEGQLEAAAEQLRQALKADPYLYPAYYHLGLAFQALGRPREAKLVWRQGIEAARRGPDRPDYERTRAVAEMSAALAGLEATERLTRAATPPPASPPPAKRPAAKQTARVVPRPAKRVTGRYAVLFSSNRKEVHARADVLRLKRRGYQAEMRVHKDRRGRRWYRVWVGCCTSRARALRLAAELRRRGLGRDLLVIPMPKP